MKSSASNQFNLGHQSFIPDELIGIVQQPRSLDLHSDPRQGPTSNALAKDCYLLQNMHEQAIS